MPNPRRNSLPRDPVLDREVDLVNQKLRRLVKSGMAYHGMKQVDLAGRMGVSQAAISLFLNGDRSLSLSTVVEMLSAVGMRLEVSLR